MSNLSQFFATGGNKIKKIQRVEASQINNGSNHIWSGTASISSVDPNKTIVVYNTMASNLGLIYDNNGAVISGHNQFGHYAYLDSATEIRFGGPRSRVLVASNGFGGSTPARLEVQIIEFE